MEPAQLMNFRTSLYRFVNHCPIACTVDTTPFLNPSMAAATGGSCRNATTKSLITPMNLNIPVIIAAKPFTKKLFWVMKLLNAVKASPINAVKDKMSRLNELNTLLTTWNANLTVPPKNVVKIFKIANTPLRVLLKFFAVSSPTRKCSENE